MEVRIVHRRPKVRKPQHRKPKGHNVLDAEAAVKSEGVNISVLPPEQKKKASDNKSQLDEVYAFTTAVDSDGDMIMEEESEDCFEQHNEGQRRILYGAT